jgi:hypothetical protein
MVRNCKTVWRRGDSNPRDPFGPSGFQVRTIIPLSCFVTGTTHGGIEFLKVGRWRYLVVGRLAPTSQRTEHAQYPRHERP